MTAISARNPNPNFAAYVSSKAGVNGLMAAIAAEYKNKGIVANALLAGGVNFPGADHFKSEEARAAAVTPEEIGNALAFFASDYASGINGESIAITGRRGAD